MIALSFFSLRVSAKGVLLSPKAYQASRREIATWKAECKKDLANSCFNAGVEYAQTLGNEREAIRYYRKSCKLGSGLGCFNLGGLQIKKPFTLKQGIQSFRRSCQLARSAPRGSEQKRVMKSGCRFADAVVKYRKLKYDLMIKKVLAEVDQPEAPTHKCSTRQSKAAEAMVDRLNSWKTVELYFRKYKQCDDGGLADGSSEAIARLFVDHWHSLPQLLTLIRKTPSFEQFVLAHVDSTLDTGDLEKMEHLSTTSCPAKATQFCRRLHDAAHRAGRG